MLKFFGLQRFSFEILWIFSLKQSTLMGHLYLYNLWSLCCHHSLLSFIEEHIYKKYAIIISISSLKNILNYIMIVKYLILSVFFLFLPFGSCFIVSYFISILTQIRFFHLSSYFIQKSSKMFIFMIFFKGFLLLVLFDFSNLLIVCWKSISWFLCVSVFRIVSFFSDIFCVFVLI